MIRVPRYYFGPTQSGVKVELQATEEPIAEAIVGFIAGPILQSGVQSGVQSGATAKNEDKQGKPMENNLRKISKSDKQGLLDELRLEMCKADLPYKDTPNTVFNDGDIDSPIMLVGEGPGEHEVLQSRPFVGRSGKLLQSMLNAAGIVRKNIYVTNVVVWRPPDNRAPTPDEINIMRPFVMNHISIIKPKILILVGGIAYRCVMEAPIAISKIRGIWQTKDYCENIINVFHPSYLLRSPTHRCETWHDILSIRTKAMTLGYRDYLENGLLHIAEK